MKKADTFIWYSGATDVTGKALVEALKVKGGIKLPSKLPEIVVGWGTKTKASVSLGKAKVLNHPDKIRNNRNKLQTLDILKKAGVKVGDFVTADSVLQALDNNNLSLPLVGRTKFHQGGKGFWLCLTKGQIQDAIKKGAEYFQAYIPIKDEYRLHIFEDEMIYAVKKVQRENMTEAFKEQHGEKISAIAGKNNKNLDKETMDYVLERVGKRVQGDADMIVRSNMRGWKFSSVKSVKDSLKTEALNAIKAVGLNFGAVDCCTDEDGNPWIIEINSGPGLQGTALEKYLAAFNKALDAIVKPEPKKTTPTTTEKTEVKVSSVGPAVSGNKKDQLKQKLALFSEMVELADENEADVLAGVAAKMFR